MTIEVVRVGECERFADQKMAKVQLFETPRFFCDLYCLRPGQSQKVHSHADNDKIYYVLRGAPTVILGEESRVLERGEMVLAAAGVTHGVTNETQEEAVCMVYMAPHPDH